MPQDPREQQNLLTALRAIAQLDGEEVLERVFSKRYLGDSKYFETCLRTRVTGILDRFQQKSKDLTVEQILQQAGLFRSSDELLFTGPITIAINGRTIDFTPLKHGAAIGARSVKELEIAGLRADTVITIENKASYLEYCSQMDDRTLTVYLAGFPGPMKKLFMKKLYEYAQKNRPAVRFLHWGDIDLGGFRIYIALKDAVPTLKPYLMDAETLQANRSQCQPLSQRYGKLLKRLLEDDDYRVFHSVIQVMLQENIRLEQEGIAVGD